VRLQPPEARALLALFLEIYPDVAAMKRIITLTGQNIEDVATNGRRQEMYLEIITNSASQNWLDSLLETAYEYTEPSDNETRDKLADLTNKIWPPYQQGPAHLHLLTANLAFVNRNHLRQTIADVANIGSPTAVVLKGATLSGTSYCWQLINHISRENGSITPIYLNIDTEPDRTPESIMRSIGRMSGFETLPTRIDLLGQDDKLDKHSSQLSLALSQWFMQQAQARILDKGQNYWLVLDNTQRDTVPPSTKELIAALTNLVGTGQVQGLALFLLGSDQSTSGAFQVHEAVIPTLGRQDISDFLQTAQTAAGGNLGDFVSVNEALDAITQNCNFALPDRNALTSVTRQLTELMRSIG
jgi:hypothetical protein